MADLKTCQSAADTTSAADDADDPCSSLSDELPLAIPPGHQILIDNCCRAYRAMRDCGLDLETIDKYVEYSRGKTVAEASKTGDQIFPAQLLSFKSLPYLDGYSGAAEIVLEENGFAIQNNDYELEENRVMSSLLLLYLYERRCGAVTKNWSWLLGKTYSQIREICAILWDYDITISEFIVYKHARNVPLTITNKVNRIEDEDRKALSKATENQPTRVSKKTDLEGNETLDDLVTGLMRKKSVSKVISKKPYTGELILMRKKPYSKSVRDSILRSQMISLKGPGGKSFYLIKDEAGEVEKACDERGMGFNGGRFYGCK